MSASNPALENITRVLQNLSYEPVVDSDSAVKSWVASHSNGVLTPFINGQFSNLTENQLKSSFVVQNPFNHSPLAKVCNCDKATLDLALDSCKSSQKSWQALSYIERGKVIYNIARNVQKNLQLLTSCESLNSGRTSREVKDLDIANVVKSLYYYAGAVGASSSTDLEPLGVIAIVGYFDSPLLSLVGKLASALVTGNTCLVIPHKRTPLSAYLFLEICVQSGVPPGVINLVASDNDELVKLVAKDPRVDCIAYDGKTSQGQELVISQSFVHPSKRTLLSLEGKSGLVVYDSADVESAIESIVDGCFYSNGQHRYSLNKVFVQENIYDDVLHRVKTRLGKLRVGNHLDKCNDFGPAASVEEFSSFTNALETQKSEFGAEVIQFQSTIQEKLSKETWLHPPTIIQNVALNSQINLNETNGPYVMLMPFRTVKESIELVNTSRFGSGLSIHTQNISLALEVAYLVNVGTVWINSFPLERGVQVRKMSGNYSVTGLKSLHNFLRSKFEQESEKVTVDVEETKAKFKSFGSLSPASSLPTAQSLSEEKTYKLYIGGKQARPDTQSSRSVYVASGDSTGQKLYCSVADASRKDVRNAVEAACSSFNGWWKRPNHNKAQIIYFFGENFLSRQHEFVNKLELLTNKPRTQCEREVKMCSDAIFYFASVCDKFIGSLNDSTDYGYLMELREPLGCIAILCGHNTKENQPLYSFILHLFAAIASGNTVVIVPDEKCPTPALDLYEVFETSDMPDGVVNILSGNKHHLAKYLCEHQQVSAVWYMSDLEDPKQADEELTAQQFIKYTSNFNLKQTWFINQAIPVNENGVDQSYLSQLQNQSVQSKYVHCPMGVIFAN